MALRSFFAQDTTTNPHWFILATAIFAILFTFYKYGFSHTYDVVAEIPCDPAITTCYVRDCEAEECPLNGMDTYRLVQTNARFLDTCPDGSCLLDCREPLCREMRCLDQDELACSSPVGEADLSE